MKLGDPQKIPGSICTVCGTMLDGCSKIGEDMKPNPGAISICMKCGNVTVFDENLLLRPATQEEIDYITKHEEFKAFYLAIKSAYKGTQH